MTNSNLNSVDIIIPCKNEQANLGSLIQELLLEFQKSQFKFQIIVVDNESTDSTKSVAQKFPVVLLTETTPGYGAAILKGLKESQSEFVVYLDGDGTYSAKDALRILNILCEKEFDLAIGSRLNKSMETKAMPALHRYFGTPFFSILIATIFQTGRWDVNSGLRAFKRSALSNLNFQSTGMEFASEFIILFVKSNLKIVEVPISYRRSKNLRSSHLRTFRDGLRHLATIFKLSFD